MRTIGSSILILEAFLALLIIPVAITVGDVDGRTVGLAAGVVILLCILGAGMITRPAGLAVGWLVQVLLLASGFWVVSMFAIGALFTFLWWCAVHWGRKVDRLRADRAAQEDAAGDQGPGQGTGPSPATGGGAEGTALA